ncbi:MAG TPA: molybdopterin converting factor subunit 1 [Flavobacteriaceae bacterium]|nr:molybdopterin converting factor subunit 1 [Flavobacteriaceae bacterium]
MNIEILFFGITADFVGKSKLEIKIPKNSTVADFKELIVTDYPNLKNINEFAIAVNEDYAEDSVKLNPNDVVAIIPPVSGG